MYGHINSCRRNAIADLLGQPELNINDLTQDYLSLLGATSPNVPVAWVQVFRRFGATALNRSQAAQEFLLGQGAPNDSITDNWYWFWCTQGGIVVGDTANMLDRDGNSYLISLGIPDRDGVLHVVTDIFLDRDGNPYQVI